MGVCHSNDSNSVIIITNNNNNNNKHKIEQQPYISSPTRSIILDEPSIYDFNIENVHNQKKLFRFTDEYKLLNNEIIGEGAFGKVYKCLRYNNNKEYAVKVLNKELCQPADIEMFKKEAELMNIIGDHKNIVQFKRLYETNKTIYLVLELVNDGNLFDMAVDYGVMNEFQVANIIRDLANALYHLHQKNIVHRDIKLENILCIQNRQHIGVKLSDFGLSKLITTSTLDMNGIESFRTLKSNCGSPLYVAPEILEQEYYGKEVDIWSLGVVCYSLLSGSNPFLRDDIFDEDDHSIIYTRIRRGIYNFPNDTWRNRSFACKKLIQRMLTINPKNRITAEEILKDIWIQRNAINRIEHPFSILNYMESTDDSSSSSTTVSPRESYFNSRFNRQSTMSSIDDEEY